jgi:hypothetical protein
VLDEGTVLAAAARAEAAGQGGVTWRDLLDLQRRRRGGSVDEWVSVAAVAARILRNGSATASPGRAP